MACASTDGADGAPGQAGSSCSVTADVPGVVTIACTDGTEATINAYTDDDAVTAMGASANDNPLRHTRYSDAEAVAAMGASADDNPLRHARYTDGDAVIAVESVGYVHGDELLPITDAIDAMRDCPADMVDAGQFCVEIDERAATTDIAQGGRACRVAGRRLCTFAEWFYACNDVVGLNDMVGNFEGSADMYLAGGLVTLGSGAASCGNVDAQGGPVPYRCCRTKL